MHPTPPSIIVPLVALGTALLAGHALAAPIVYDAFDYASAAPLAGQTNPGINLTWQYVGTGANSADPTIGAGSLPAPSGLPASSGNSVLTNRTQSGATRLTVPGLPSSGSIFYSGIVRVNDLTGLTNTTTGSFFAGFNNASGAGVSITSSGAALMIHLDPTNASAFNLGIAVSTANPDRIFDTVGHAAGETLFIIGSYTYNSNADDDVARLWINPDPALFAANNPPAATVTSDGAASVGTASDAVGSLVSFFLRNNSVEPAQIQFDELRVGSTPADVVTNIPEPSTCALAIVASASLLLGRRRRTVILELSPPSGR